MLVDLVGSYGRGVVLGVGAYAHLVGWRLVTPPIWGMVSRPEDVRRWRVDALVAMVHNPHLLRRVRQLRVPTVNVSGSQAASGLTAVISDNAAIGRAAAEHLWSLGLREFACQHVGPRWSLERGEAFLDWVEQRGLATHASASGSNPEWSVSDRFPIVDPRAWLRSLPKPVGLFVPNDTGARLAMDDCYDLRLRVPEDVAVLGVDDDPLVARLTYPSLSSVLTNSEQIGYRAAELLDRLMSGERPPDEPVRIPPTGIAARGSTQVAAVDDPWIAGALRFIREHADRPLSVQDVLDPVPLSRRPFEKRFRKLLGRSVLEEIHRAKVERAQRLLVETDLTVAQVGRACGCANASRFGVMFRKRTGQTPAGYRAQSRLTRG